MLLQVIFIGELVNYKPNQIFCKNINPRISPQGIFDLQSSNPSTRTHPPNPPAALELRGTSSSLVNQRRGLKELYNKYFPLFASAERGKA